MSGRSSSIPAPQPTSAEQIRNVVLVGPGGSGKSTLFDHLVTEASGSPAAAQAGESRNALTAASLSHDAFVLNLLDTPGHPDFTGDLRAGLRAADAAVFVVSAADGVDATTRALWHECDEVDLPRMVAIVQLDARDADFDATLADCQAQFGEGVQPLGVPLSGAGGAVTHIADLMLGEVHDYSGSTREVHQPGEDEAAVYDTYRPPLLEGIITESEDDTLMDRYLGGEEIGFDILEADLLTAISRGHFHPVLALSAETGAGIDVLLHLIEVAFPPPTGRPMPTVTTPTGAPAPALTADPDGPLVAEIIKTTSDQYVGHVSLVRVFSGTLRPDAQVHISGHLSAQRGTDSADHDEDVRIAGLSSPLGDTLRPRTSAIAGEICVITKLAQAQTTDTISDPEQPLLVEPWHLPEPLLPTALTASTRGDEDKLPPALAELVAEDPTLRVDHNAETGQIVLWTLGQAHQDQVLQRLRDRYRVTVGTEPVRVALRETFAGRIDAHGRHVKQSGGHGQYAICELTVEPLERGAGIEFTEVVVGGAVPRQFIPSVEKGARAQLARGLLSGFPVVDVKITLTDGKAHSVDSSDAAFQSAAASALREIASDQTIVLLEPVDVVEIVVDDEFTGAVMTDLQGRRARILGTAAGDRVGRSTVTAEAPQLELLDYAIALRSLAHGTGAFRREHRGYEVMPEKLARDQLDR